MSVSVRPPHSSVLVKMLRLSRRSTKILEEADAMSRATTICWNVWWLRFMWRRRGLQRGLSSHPAAASAHMMGNGRSSLDLVKTLIEMPLHPLCSSSDRSFFASASWRSELGHFYPPSLPSIPLSFALCSERTRVPDGLQKSRACSFFSSVPTSSLSIIWAFICSISSWKIMLGIEMGHGAVCMERRTDQGEIDRQPNPKWPRKRWNMQNEIGGKRFRNQLADVMQH